MGSEKPETLTCLRSMPRVPMAMAFVMRFCGAIITHRVTWSSRSHAHEDDIHGKATCTQAEDAHGNDKYNRQAR